jgi:hypothetical protein
VSSAAASAVSQVTRCEPKPDPTAPAFMRQIRLAYAKRIRI